MVVKSLKKVDIVIVGAGCAGLTMACMLAKTNLSILVIDRASRIQEPNQPSRLLAISKSSVELLEDNHCIKSVENIGQAINRVRVVDNDSYHHLDFFPDEVGLDNTGFMIEESKLHTALEKQLIKIKNVEIQLGNTVVNLNNDDTKVVLELNGNVQIEAGLLIAADGKNSFIRHKCGINIQEKKYNQVGIVADIKHTKPHYGIAIEKFLPNGPFAMLPKKDGYTTSIVWSEKSSLWEQMSEWPEKDIFEMIQLRFGNHFGATTLGSHIKAFPLSMTNSNRYVDNNIAFIGDAAHSLHPIAGQGFNLAIRDIYTLSSLIQNQIDQGLQLNDNAMLQAYNKNRFLDSSIMVSICDELNAIFSNNAPILRELRRIGISAINNMPVLKSQLMKYAMGYIYGIEYERNNLQQVA